MRRFDPANWLIDWPALAEASLLAGIAVVAALVIHWAVFALAMRVARMSETQTDDLVLARIRRPAQWAMAAIALTMAAQHDKALSEVWEPLAQFLRPALLGWIAYALVKALTTAMELRLDANIDPVAVRSRRTRLAILSRASAFAIVFVTVGLMLMAIPAVHTIGTTVLASAGLAALAVGAAAQPALKSLIAGLQVAITEPVRIGDLVVVDGHTGRVEEIRMSFVIVRTWDERAVVVPTLRFLDQTFENWSGRNEALTGPVFLFLDPATPVEPIRAEFLRFLATRSEWDGRKGAALVIEAFPESIQLRLAMSASTIAALFELRCAVREHMLGWLAQELPGALIRHPLEGVEASNALVAGKR